MHIKYMSCVCMHVYMSACVYSMLMKSNVVSMLNFTKLFLGDPF